MKAPPFKSQQSGVVRLPSDSFVHLKFLSDLNISFNTKQSVTEGYAHVDGSGIGTTGIIHLQTSELYPARRIPDWVVDDRACSLIC